MKRKKRKPTYLCFKIGKENYAVSTKNVIEVLEKQYITPVPNTDDYIEGIVSFRGNIIPVICLQTKLNLKDINYNENFVIIIFEINLNSNRTAIAAIADEVNEVISAEDHEIESVAEDGIRFNTEFLVGMLKYNSAFALLLNVDRIFETT